jgi:hypothetical protein
MNNETDKLDNDINKINKTKLRDRESGESEMDGAQSKDILATIITCQCVGR